MVVSEANATIISAVIALGGSLFFWWRSERLARRINAQAKDNEDRANYIDGYRSLVTDLQRNNRAQGMRIDNLEKERRETRAALAECEEQNAGLHRRVASLERRLGLEGADGAGE